jgi:DNA repair exonuclease SbcCD ATPase subunit
MKITDATIENFLSIGEAKLSLDTLGLVMVQGINDDETSADSNGSGKSSLADAFSWCLWGSTARGVTGDEVINTAAGKDTKVSLTIDDDGEVYRVERYRKAKKFKNGLYLYKLDNGAWIDLTKGTTTQTQKQVERLLGCSEEVFNAAVYSGQEMMPDIPRMTDKQLKLLVEQAAGVDVLANAYDIARERMRAVSQKRSETQVAFDRAVERHGDAKAHIERLSDQSSDWDRNQTVKIANLKQQTIDAKTEFELGKAELNADEEKQLRDSIADCERKIAAVNEERDREQVLLADLSTAQAALNGAQRKVTTDETMLANAQRSVADKEAALEHIKTGVGKPCKTCSRPLEGEHLAGAIENAEQALAAQIEDKEACSAGLAKSQARAMAAQKMVTAAEQELAKHRASMTDVSGEGQRLANLRRELQIIDTTKAEVERLKQRTITIAEQWKREAAADNPFKKMIEQANEDLLARAKDVSMASVEAQQAAEEERYAQAVVDVFAPAGVRAHRLDEATPYLNERTAHYLGSLADGAIEAFWTTLTETKGKGDLREKFSVTVEKAGSAPSFNALSGGEKRKVRLACALALQDLVATRAAKNIELWIGDEIDDALDPAGLERLMGVLEEKARERGTVLVISHNDIQDFARKTITVKKAQGRATVSVS